MGEALLFGILSLFYYAQILKLDQEFENISGKSNRVTDKIIEKRISLLVLIILLLTMQWLLSFFGQSIIPGVPHTGGFIYVLSVAIVALIIIKFLAWPAPILSSF